MMNEPTSKQIWAVETIINYSKNKYKEPEYTFTAYRNFISEHFEEYQKCKTIRNDDEWAYNVDYDDMPQNEDD